MAIGNNMGVNEVTFFGKLTDAQIAMTDGDLTTNLNAAYVTNLTVHSLQIKSGESATVLFNRSLRKFKVSSLTETL